MALRPVTLLAAISVALYTVLQTASFITLTKQREKMQPAGALSHQAR